MVGLEYYVVDVFAEQVLEGNQLAVFPDGADIDETLMQKIARAMNLSETTFVTESSGTSYTSRIFTPSLELPFAGHPTLGTAWVLRSVGKVGGDAVVQKTRAGEAQVRFEGDRVSFTRP